MKRLQRSEGITNRDIVKFAKKTKHWCETCDLYLIFQGEKCPICGQLSNKDHKKRRIFKNG